MVYLITIQYYDSAGNGTSTQTGYSLCVLLALWFKSEFASSAPHGQHRPAGPCISEGLCMLLSGPLVTPHRCQQHRAFSFSPGLWPWKYLLKLPNATRDKVGSSWEPPFKYPVWTPVLKTGDIPSGPETTGSSWLFSSKSESGQNDMLQFWLRDKLLISGSCWVWKSTVLV